MAPNDERVIVSSSRINTSPSLTTLPSLTKIWPTMPPSGCCTFLMLELDHNCALPNHSTGKGSRGGPSTEATKEQHSRREPKQVEPAD